MAKKKTRRTKSTAGGSSPTDARPATGNKSRANRRPAAGATTSASSDGRPDRATRQLAVVGIGASAGGLSAFREFLSAMPADSGLAFVLIQHLAPMHESLTAELLSKHTPMPVAEVRDGMRIEPNCVYVIAPNRYLTISGETLHLTEPVDSHAVRVPIDFFFRSLADEQQQRAIGVILSGAGADGALGAREIKAAGGMVMAQQPDTAQYDSMPRSAIDTGVVDHVLPISKMPDVLVRYVQHWYVNGSGAREEEATTTAAPDDLQTILSLLRARLKYDFSGYKKGTLTRRIQRRMGLHHVVDLERYVEMLRNDRDELAALYKDLLISVTNFFREPEAWQELERLVIDPLVKSQPDDSPIRAWTPGCATGEEPYSLAMLLVERMHANGKWCGMHIFASDIDQDALAFARAGVYPESIAADVSPERLQRFFTKGEHTYRINKDLRESIVFAEQNLVGDPPFSRLDLICCRNLMFYLEPELQNKVLGMFHFALCEGGYLLLGNAETINQQEGLFQAVSRKWRIYRRVGPVRPQDLELPMGGRAVPPLIPLLSARGGPRRISPISALAQTAILRRYAPACVIVNRNLEVLYLHGSVDDYLQLPSGELASDLISMSRPGLRTKLRAAINQALATNKPAVAEDVRIKRGDKYFSIRVSVEPLRELSDADGVLLVAFDEASTDKRVRIVYVEPRDEQRTDRPETADEFESVIHQLEEELRSTREDLQTTIEELETSNEEFKAANEEVTSVNEELQSTNEELETSKEELQSVNEELHTVNNQLEQKVQELEAMTDDLSNLLKSSDIATIFLDRQFRLRLFTPAAKRLLRVIESDVGRPIADFAQKFTDARMLIDAEMVLEKLTPVEEEVQAHDGRWYLRRVAPYRTEDDRISGVVITFVDIHQRKLHEAELKELAENLERRVVERTTELGTMNLALQTSEGYFRELLEAAPDAMIVVDGEKAILRVNQQTERLFGYPREQLEGQPIETLMPERYRGVHREHVFNYFRDPQTRPMGVGLELWGEGIDAAEIPVEIQLSPVDIAGQVLVIAAVRDMSERRDTY